MNNVKTYVLDEVNNPTCSVTIFTVNNKVTLAKCNKSGKFVKHVVAQTLLNDYLSKQTLTYMILNAVTVLSVLNFFNVLVNKTVNPLGTVNKLMCRFKLIDLFMLVIGSIDLILYCKWIA